MISVGIIGGSGYTGKKLVQFCESHKKINEYKVYGFSTAGSSVYEIFPDLAGIIKNQSIINIEQLSFEHDVYFIALPHGESLNYVPGLISAGKTAIDLGGDYRLNNPDDYIEWYKYNHTSPEFLKDKIYGLADLAETNYSGSSLIANPGCYPTAVSLSLIPFIKNFSDEIITISTSAYSGTSGAGKSPKQHLLMSEMNGNAAAYNLNSHRHYPEILQTLNKFGLNSPFSFATHLLPVSVGIYSTSFIHLKSEINQEEIFSIYKQYYENSPFVRLRNQPPNLTWVTNTNFCDLGISVKGKSVIIVSAIDNLIKGASGQAIQNLNRFYGYDETEGLLDKNSILIPERVSSIV